MGNGAVRPMHEDSLRAVAKLPDDGSDLAGSSAEELLAHIVQIRAMVRASLLQYDKQVEMLLDETQKAKKARHDSSVLLPPALSHFCTIANSHEMKPLYEDVAAAQTDFQASKNADDTALGKAVSALMAQLPKSIEARANAPGSFPEFQCVVETGNEFFEGVYTQVPWGWWWG